MDYDDWRSAHGVAEPSELPDKDNRINIYETALQSIAKTQYGLQSVQEKHLYWDTKEFYEEAMDYYMKLAYRFQKVARNALDGKD